MHITRLRCYFFTATCSLIQPFSVRPNSGITKNSKSEYQSIKVTLLRRFGLTCKIRSDVLLLYKVIQGDYIHRWCLFNFSAKLWQNLFDLLAIARFVVTFFDDLRIFVHIESICFKSELPTSNICLLSNRNVSEFQVWQIRIEVDRTSNLAAISKVIRTLSLVCKKCRSLQEGPTPITKIKNIVS